METATPAGTSGLAPSGRAHNLLVGRDVEIDTSAVIGANVILYDGVRIAAGATIKHNCVIGEPPTLAPTSNANPPERRQTLISAGATVCNGAVILAGARIGPRTIIGDQTYMREGATLAEDCVLGRGCAVGAGATVGARTKIQSGSIVLPGMLVEEDVFIGGMVCGASDHTMGRVPQVAGGVVTLRRGCRIGSGALLMPGVEVGSEAFVGAGAVVLEDVPAHFKVAGVPARVIGRSADA